MEFNFFTFLFLFAILTSVITLLWLNFRQDKSIKNSFDKVPQGFSDNISIEDHQKAGKYTQAKLHLVVMKRFEKFLFKIPKKYSKNIKQN